MAVRDHMYELADLHVAHLGQHVQEHGVLAYIPVVGGQYVLGTLVQNAVQDHFAGLVIFRDIECHGVGAGVQMHVAQILEIVDVGHDPAAVGVIFKIVDHAVPLVQHDPLFPILLHDLGARVGGQILAAFG